MRTFNVIAAVFVTFITLTQGCAPTPDAPETTVQAGGIWPGIAPLPPTGIPIPTSDPCNHGDDRLILIGLSFQCPACINHGDVGAPDGRPTPSLSTAAAAPWYPQLVRFPTRNYWVYRDIQVTAWIATAEALWPTLHPTTGGALANFRHPTLSPGWLFEANPLWMSWKVGTNGNGYTTDGFDSAGRTLYGNQTHRWGSANMIRGGYRPPPGTWGIWYERWLLICRDGGIEAGDALPYLDLHQTKKQSHNVTIFRHPASNRCPRVTYSCSEADAPVNYGN